VERSPPPPPGRVVVEAARGGQRALGVHRDEGAQAPVEPRGALEAVTGGLDRGELAVANRGRDPGQARDVRHEPS